MRAASSIGTLSKVALRFIGRLKARPGQDARHRLWAAFGINRPATNGRTPASALDAQD